jgi:hypothetical protein
LTCADWPHEYSYPSERLSTFLKIILGEISRACHGRRMVGSSGKQLQFEMIAINDELEPQSRVIGTNEGSAKTRLFIVSPLGSVVMSELGLSARLGQQMS